MEISTKKILGFEDCVVTEDYNLISKDGEPLQLSEQAIKNIIRMTLPLESDRIVVVNTTKDRFLCDDYTYMGLYDDVYTDGSICESSLGKVLVDYNIGIILQRGFTDGLVRGVFIVLYGSNREDIFNTHSKVLLKYLRPEVFSLLV